MKANEQKKQDETGIRCVAAASTVHRRNVCWAEMEETAFHFPHGDSDLCLLVGGKHIFFSICLLISDNIGVGYIC